MPDGCLSLREETMATGQAERLMPMLQEMLAEAGLGWRDLRRVGVGTGPGNFTGVRIAVAAARGLALGLGVPAVGVTRLEALAFGLGAVTVVEDARRGEVYVQQFDGALGDGPGGPLSGARLMAVAGLRAARAVGSGAALVAGAEVLAPHVALAEAVARIAALRALGTRPAPFYLRGADAAPPADPPPVILP
jgi:tRNA threonylcarbamoyladenosine biosynthesis protein TsaB